MRAGARAALDRALAYIRLATDWELEARDIAVRRDVGGPTRSRLAPPQRSDGRIRLPESFHVVASSVTVKADSSNGSRWSLRSI